MPSEVVLLRAAQYNAFPKHQPYHAHKSSHIYNNSPVVTYLSGPKPRDLAPFPHTSPSSQLHTCSPWSSGTVH